MNKWEYLIHRALLAGIKVDDSGYSVQFQDGSCCATFSKVAPHNGQPGVDAAAQWLMQECDMHIPGWQLPWPAEDPCICFADGEEWEELQGHDWKTMEDGSSRCTNCGTREIARSSNL